MGWIVRGEDGGEPHHCPTPEGRHTDGDLWRCDGCGDLWAWTAGCWGWATRWERFQAWSIELLGLAHGGES